MLPHWMLKSRAWRSLPPEAEKLLIDGVWIRFNGVNNGEISFACSEAPEVLGFSASTASRMFTILIERGFLVIVRNALFKVRTKYCRTWRITALPAFGNPATKDYMRWRTGTGNSKDSSVASVKPSGCTSEIKDAELTPSVSPMKPKEPIRDQNRFHPCNTYNIPCEGGVALGPRWEPSRTARTRAHDEFGIPWGDVSRLAQLFREHPQSRPAVSTDWDAEWLHWLKHLLTVMKEKGANDSSC
jgi:hypothetical protein